MSCLWPPRLPTLRRAPRARGIAGALVGVGLGLVVVCSGVAGAAWAAGQGREAQGAPSMRELVDAPRHSPEEPALRRWARETGPLGWGGVVVGIGLLGLAWDRLGRRRERTARRAPGLGALAGVVVLGASGGLGIDAVAQRMLVAPLSVRGPPPPGLEPAPAGTGIVYFAGESTMAGEPFYERATIPDVVARAFRASPAGDAIRTRNYGVSGTCLQEGWPEAIRAALADPGRYGTAAVVAYYGHNCVPIVEASGAPREDALEELRDALEAMVEATEAHEVPVILVLALGNVDDLPPRFGELDPRRRRADKERVEAGTRRAAELLGEGGAPEARAREAKALLDELLELAPEWGPGWFLRSRAHRALGDLEGAQRDAWQAVALDRFPIRAPRWWHEELLEACEEHDHVHCLDLEGALRERFGGLGDALFVDAHHPSWQGYFAIGGLVAERLAGLLGVQGIVVPEAPPIPPRPAREALRHTVFWWLGELLLPQYALFDAYAAADAHRRIDRALDAWAALPAPDADPDVDPEAAAVRDDRTLILRARILLAGARGAPIDPAWCGPEARLEPTPGREQLDLPILDAKWLERMRELCGGGSRR